MTASSRIWAVAGFGVVTSLLLALGVDTIGSLMALAQLGGLIGAPTALLLRNDLRSTAATVVIAGVLSIAISAIAVQSLVWFEWATGPAIVLLATAYGVVLARLLTGSDDLAEASAGSGSRW
ncbi:MAG: hypothetical protein AAGA93_10390 [Actinomycetota bacterium]